VSEVDGAGTPRLIKVRRGDGEARDAMIGELAGRTGAALVQRIGHTAILYRLEGQAAHRPPRA
jgi:RNA-binding protein YhbY